MDTQICGFCSGAGQVQQSTYDRLGYPNARPAVRVCEYCGGSGQVEDGDKLKANTYRPGRSAPPTR